MRDKTTAVANSMFVIVPYVDRGTWMRRATSEVDSPSAASSRLCATRSIGRVITNMRSYSIRMDTSGGVITVVGGGDSGVSCR